MNPSASELVLVAPDWAAHDTLWRHRLPFVLWPIGGRPLLADWMDEAVRRGCPRVVIHAADRPAEIREALEGGQYWSVPVEVRPVADPALLPAGAVRVTGLAGTNDPAWEPASPVALLDHYRGLQARWLEREAAAGTSIHTRHESGAIVGPRVAIGRNVRVTPPVWLGARVTIEDGVVLGPDAYVASDSIIGEGAVVVRSVVQSSSSVGDHVSIDRMLVDGGCLVDLKRGLRIDIGENFILGKTGTDERIPGLLERAIAFVVWLLLWPAAWFSGGKRGPLILRRHGGLGEIAAGRRRWIGLLPREEKHLATLPPETADRLRAAPVGLFSLADAHGVHTPEDPEEWVHAACQALDPASARQVRSRILHLAFLNPEHP